MSKIPIRQALIIGSTTAFLNGCGHEPSEELATDQYNVTFNVLSSDTYWYPYHAIEDGTAVAAEFRTSGFLTDKLVELPEGSRVFVTANGKTVELIKSVYEEEDGKKEYFYLSALDARAPGTVFRFEFVDDNTSATNIVSDIALPPPSPDFHSVNGNNLPFSSPLELAWTAYDYSHPLEFLLSLSCPSQVDTVEIQFTIFDTGYISIDTTQLFNEFSEPAADSDICQLSAHIEGEHTGKASDYFDSATINAVSRHEVEVNIVVN